MHERPPWLPTPPEGDSAIGIMNSAPYLYRVAMDAVRRTKSADSDTSPGQLDALVSVVFSVSALEAFINEIATLASMGPQRRGPSTLLLGDLLKEIEAGQGSIQSKFSLAKSILSGQPYDKSAQPYQDFQLLIGLRNHLVHVRDLSEVVTSFSLEEGWQLRDSSRMADRLRSRNIIAEESGGFPAPIEHFLTRGVAKWSCDTAALMAQSIISSISDDEELKSTVESVYLGHFQKVDS